MADLNVMKTKYNEEVHKIKTKKGKNHQLFTHNEYLLFINKVKASKAKVSRKTPEEYQRLSRYDILTIENIERLVVPASKNGDQLIIYTYLEETFDIIHETHTSSGHIGRNKMMKILKSKYKNITVELVIIYLSLCEECRKKHSFPKKMLMKSLKGNELMSRGQVDVFDMQSQADGDFKFFMVYQDLLTKFIQLKALKTNSPKEVAHYLLDIFTIFGAPCILHSVNGREFINEVIQELSQMWTELKIVNGKPREGQRNEYMHLIAKWLKDKKTTKWSEGLKFIQFMKNKTISSTTGSPYEAMFGYKAKMGLTLPAETLSEIKTEEDLELLILQGQPGNPPETLNTESLKEDCSSDEYADTSGYLEVCEHPVKPEPQDLQPGTSKEQNYIRKIKDEPIDNYNTDTAALLQENQKAKELLLKGLKRSNSTADEEIETFLPIKVEKLS